MKKYFDTLLTDLTIYNCNGRIRFLRKRQDQLSNGIDAAIELKDPQLADAYQKIYDDCVDVMKQLLEFRRNNKCLIEGDPGYQAI